MAITVRNFAALVAFIQYRIIQGFVLDKDHINELLHFCEDMQEPVSTEPAKVDLAPLFNAICNNKKIEAIKEYRTLTGFGLKESKDEIERLMNYIADNERAHKAEVFLTQLVTGAKNNTLTEDMIMQSLINY